jgi:GMP synthase (glutamine-hydrolysing)
MAKQESKINILYIQVREDAVTCEEELQEFIRYSGLNKDQFDVLNVFDTPKFPAEKATNYDAVFVGGSSDASVIEPEKYPFVEFIKNLLVHCIKINKPVFASCFGFQAGIEALGGKIILDKEKMEMNTYPMYLTAAAKKDPLFCDIKNGFLAVSGHQERAKTIPKNAILLAYSTLCPFHAIKIKNKPFYAFQFHPEVNQADLISRIIRYKERYSDGDNFLQNIIDTCQETPEANKLVRKFVDRVLLAD